MRAIRSDNIPAGPDLARVLERIEEHLALLKRNRSQPSLDWLTVAEAASMLKVSRDTIERLVASGEVRSATIETAKSHGQRKLRRIRRDWLEDYLESKAEQACRSNEKARPRRRRLKFTPDFFG